MLRNYVGHRCPRNFWSSHPGECEWIACHLRLGPSVLWKQRLLGVCFPLPLLMSARACSAWPEGVSSLSSLSLWWIMESWGGPKDHPSCFWATKVLTADLPVNFTLVSLGRDFRWFPYFFPPSYWINLTAKDKFGEKLIQIPGRDTGDPFF